MPRHKKFDEIEYFEMTPRQLAEFQASPRPAPGTMSAGWTVAIVTALVVAWRVLVRLGYFV